MKKIYLDYAATSPTKTEVVEAMKPYFTEIFGNPSSIHSFGRESRVAVDKARAITAKFLNCRPEEIIFTSGGTEADNLAIKGIIENSKSKPHIITSQFEHHAILHTCQDLEKRGLAEVTYIKPNKEGIIEAKEVKKAIKPNTILISIMYVNNEIGTVQPVVEISKLKSQNLKLLIHTDAVQAVEYQDCDVEKLKVDMLSLSAHKFGGPKGVGVLYVKKGTPLHKQNIGGAQEYNLRAGTENVAGIVGLGKAIELISQKREANSQKLIKLRDYLIDSIMKKIPNTILNGSHEKRSPNNVSFSFKNAEGEAILLNLDLAGIAASSGSACTSGSLEPSHVLLAIGIPAEVAHGSVRFTLGEKTTKQEIDHVIKILPPIISKLRKMSPFGGNNE